jgi:hypothetical protein
MPGGDVVVGGSVGGGVDMTIGGPVGGGVSGGGAGVGGTSGGGVTVSVGGVVVDVVVVVVWSKQSPRRHRSGINHRKHNDHQQLHPLGAGTGNSATLPAPQPTYL